MLHTGTCMVTVHTLCRYTFKLNDAENPTKSDVKTCMKNLFIEVLSTVQCNKYPARNSNNVTRMSVSFLENF